MEDFDEFVKGYDEENQPFDVIQLKMQVEELQKQNLKLQRFEKVSISKPKGDIEMKNITYRASEKRYIGRKQLHGKIVTVYAKTQAECLKKLNQQIRELKNEWQIKQKFKQKAITFKEYWEKWYKENKENYIADGTKQEYEIAKRKFEPLHNIPLKNITKEILLKQIESMPKNRTTEKNVTILKTMFATAQQENMIKYNPFTTLVFKKKKRKPKPPFNYEEQKIILENLKGKEFEPIILLYLTAGLRKTEMNFASIEKDIDENNILTAVNLKGRDREIRYKKIKLSVKMAEIVRKNADIFHKYTARMIFDKFNDFLGSLNIKGSIVNCRHTFATNCFYLGKDSLIISREMGHTTSQITKDNYIDIDYNLSKEKILKLYNNLYNLN